MTQLKEYLIYENMLKAATKATVNDDLVFSCSTPENEMLFFLAKELAKVHAENPICPGEPGYKEYEDLMYFYDMWPDNKPDCAFKKRFLYAGYKLCQYCPSNIFEYQEEPVIELSLEELKEKEYRETEEEDIATETYVPVQEPTTVMGVVPFKDEPEYVQEVVEREFITDKQRKRFGRNKRRR